MAKQLRIQGDVVLRIVISESGAVKLRAIESGSPLLSSSAIDAIIKWRYSPFLVAGKHSAVETVVTIPFSLGDTPERIKQLAEINNRYFEAFNLCHKERTANQLAQAEANCKRAVALADQLDPARRSSMPLAKRATRCSCSADLRSLWSTTKKNWLSPKRF
jgi:TonB family protein